MISVFMVIEHDEADVELQFYKSMDF